MKNNKDGTVVIICDTKEDSELIMGHTKTISRKYDVNMQELKKPRIKVVNIASKYNVSELQEMIVKQNFENYKNLLCKVMYRAYTSNI